MIDIAAFKFSARPLATVCAFGLILSGCGGAEIYPNHIHQSLVREDCRVECRVSRYAEGVGTECFGRCMEQRGYRCVRDFSVSCAGQFGCHTAGDYFRCDGAAPEAFVSCVEARKSTKPELEDFGMASLLGDANPDAMKKFVEDSEQWIKPCLAHQ